MDWTESEHTLSTPKPTVLSCEARIIMTPPSGTDAKLVELGENGAGRRPTASERNGLSAPSRGRFREALRA